MISATIVSPDRSPSNFPMRPHHRISNRPSFKSVRLSPDSHLAQASKYRTSITPLHLPDVCTRGRNYISILFSPDRYAWASLENATRQPGPQK